MKKSIKEVMTFNQMVQNSEPRRIVRSRTVTGPPLDIEAFQDVLYWSFNFKASPSTTGKRHHGYIKFLKPPRPDTPMGDVKCLVDCTCQDFRYRWAWVLKQKGSSRVGPGSMNQAWNQAPRITNPHGQAGICKHILALRDYLWSAADWFPGTSTEREGASRLMNRLVRYANNRWTSSPQDDEEARRRETTAQLTRTARNRGSQVPGGSMAGGPPDATVVSDEDDLDQQAMRERERQANRNPQNPRNESMSTLKEQIKVMEELVAGSMGTDNLGAVDIGFETPGPEGCQTCPGQGQPESEALGILREIRDLIAKLSSEGDEDEIGDEELGAKAPPELKADAIEPEPEPEMPEAPAPQEMSPAPPSPKTPKPLRKPRPQEI